MPRERKRFLTINFDGQLSFELGIEIGRRSSTSPERPFSLGEIIHLYRPENAAPIDGIMIREATQLPEALRHLAQLTSNHAVAFLQGGELPFSQIASQRQAEGDSYALEKLMLAARARARANAVWKR